MSDLITKENELTREQVQAISATVEGIVGPIIDRIGLILKQNTEAMERIAATQQMMSARISDLEKQMRLKTPMSRSQEKHVNDAIRKRAFELMDAKGYGNDKKAVNKMALIIRRSVLSRYGADSLREAPAYDYDTAIAAASGYNDLLAIRDVAREAKKRAEKENE